jgi:ATP-dependent DNA helicase RecG
LDSEVLDERRFEGDLITVLRELDGFLRTLFPSRPESVSPLKEDARTPYPILAVRELLMNAVMHRDYESNAPVRFYWFDDRIEIQNPGGLYGAVTPETFPNQNDYRNPKIAEAMKTLGYVNAFGRGIARTQRFLRDNGNPEAEFQIDQPAFFLATVKRIAR